MSQHEKYTQIPKVKMKDWQIKKVTQEQNRGKECPVDREEITNIKEWRV